jgi:hypothetical protein
MVLLRNQVNIIESTMKKTSLIPESNRIKEIKKDYEFSERDVKNYNI